MAQRGKKSRKQKEKGVSGADQQGQLEDNVGKGTVAIRASKRQKKLGLLSDDSTTNPGSVVDLPSDAGIKTSDRIDAATVTFQEPNKLPSVIDNQGKMPRSPQQGNTVVDASQVERTIIPGKDLGGVAAGNEFDISEGEKERIAAVAVLEARIAASKEKKVASDENEKECAKVDIAAEKKKKRMAAVAQLR